MGSPRLKPLVDHLNRVLCLILQVIYVILLLVVIENKEPKQMLSDLLTNLISLFKKVFI